VTEAADAAAQLNRALTRVHRGVLATLALCALLVFTATTDGGPEVTDTARGGFFQAAIALAVASILARTASVSPRPPRIRIRLALVSLVLAGAIGVVSVVCAVVEGQRDGPLLYTLGAAILALRPPVRVVTTP
jgi:peptidoglycan/LPS O-acetylase OafA/YrhL